MVFRYFVSVKVNKQGEIIGRLGKSDEIQDKRLENIEKKNGNEQHQIDELKKLVEKQSERIECLEKKILRKDGIIEGLERANKTKE